MNAVSFFDGMSCGQIALERAGHAENNYYACEIDKPAIQVALDNYPNTIQLGDVTKVGGRGFTVPIDLFIGGSPCQGFSFVGKQLNFEDPRSRLFFEYVRVLKELRYANPSIYFLLENVFMAKKHSDVISSALDVEPLFLNSSNVSAQARRRLYWTNIPGVTELQNKNIFMPKILEQNVDESFYLTGNRLGWWNKNKDFQLQKKYSSLDADKAICMTARQYASWNGNFVTQNGRVRQLTPVECERLQTVPDNYTKSASNSQRYKMLGNGWTVDVIAHIFSFIPKN